MQVYKFGGASIATPERVRALLPIVSSVQGALVIVISALGKTTNGLEKIVQLACSGHKQEALTGVDNLIEEHRQYALALLGNTAAYTQALDLLQPVFDELHRGVQMADGATYDRAYDSMVCLGELFSTLIIHCYLQQQAIANQWIDARTLLRTDATYRDAAIDWEVTQLQVKEKTSTPIAAGNIVITQGFIGATPAGDATTLGREGSDYTAAVLAAILGASAVTIWKDVPGLLNADPKMFNDTVLIEAIPFSEVIEMAFYGAQIIHPKTIKPLQNQNIPLYVKCFLDPTLPGTKILPKVEGVYPPLIVRKDDQLLVQVTTRDYSFITEDNLSVLYAIFHKLKIKINLIQNAAISFTACIDNRPEKITLLIAELTPKYEVRINQQVSLLTIRHYTPQSLSSYTQSREILLKQETRKTLQVVMK